MSRPVVRTSHLVAALSLAIAFAPQPRAAEGPAGHLSAEGRNALHAMLDSGVHDDLAWPDFGPLRKDVERFYRDGGYALAWVRSSSPTEQARAAVLVLRNAAAKGLEPGDYDGPRWPERLARFEGSAPAVTEPEQVRFDVALTV